MIEENAFIVEVCDEFAWVETQRQSSCGTCQVQKACGTSVLSQVLGKKRTKLQVMNPRHFNVGDEVILGLQENALVKGSLMLYALPLAFMFGFAIMGYFVFFLYELNYTEGFKILFSLSGLASGFFWVSRVNKKISDDPNYQAVILSKVTSKVEKPSVIISI